MSNEVLHTNDSFNVVLKDGRYGIEPNKLSVIVMAYTSIRGLPVAIGVINEINPFREGGTSGTLVTGSSNDEDPDILSTAQRKLKESSGFDVMDPDRWTFLGFLTDGKYSSNSSPCFACDVTELEPVIVEDESDAPKSIFVMSPIKDALNTDDCFIPALFMKMFRYIFGNSTSDDVNNDSESKQQDDVSVQDTDTDK